jgi:hypothetical protein
MPIIIGNDTYIIVFLQRTKIAFFKQDSMVAMTFLYIKQQSITELNRLILRSDKWKTISYS